MSSRTNKDGFARYDARISFDLPDGYEFEDKPDDDGDRKVQIKVNPRVDEDGETKYENEFLVLLQTPDEIPDGQTALDAIEEGQGDALFCRRFDGPPQSLVFVSSTSTPFLFMTITIHTFSIAVEVSDKEVLLLKEVKVGDINDETVQTTVNQLVAIWKSMMIDGNKVTTGHIDAAQIAALAAGKQDEAQEAEESPLHNEARIRDGCIEIGTNWRMELPSGVRARLDTRGEDEDYDKLTLLLGSEDIGNCSLADTVRVQKRCALASEMAIGVTCRNKLFTASIRDDEWLKVESAFHISATGRYAFSITIEEKKPVSVTYFISITPNDSIENLMDALNAIKEKEAATVHPFGRKYARYQEMTVRLAASIQPVGRPEEALSMGPVQRIGKIAEGKLPSGLQSSKLDGRILYVSSDTPIDESAWQHASRFPYYMMQEEVSPALDLQDTEQMWLRNLTIFHVMRTQFLGHLAVILRNHVADAGLKSLLVIPEGGTFVAIVCIVGADGTWTHLKIDSSSGYCPGKLLRYANAIYDSIVLDGDDEDDTPRAFPPLDDIYHEHYTLVTSGSYTTRRDADFVGQPVRMLMEKCGSEGEEAYDMMKIDDDAYSLDDEARRLATVFRVNEDLFDPYNDAEAMIHRAMFADTRMFHALRSLAWMVMSGKDQNGRDPASLTFDELNRFGEALRKMNYLNYAEKSSSAGLCSHYDWRVFYVPDSYIGSDCWKKTDLRELCGKENRGGNSVHLVFFGLNGLSGMHDTNRLISRNEETVESLDALRADLAALLPVMKTIYTGLMADRDRSEKLEGPLADALTAWCALAVAAKEPFYSEEAADTPEADAGMEEPLERIDTPLDDARTAGKRTGAKPAAPGTAAPVPDGDILDLGGETVIRPEQFAGNMQLRRIAIPEGVTEIGEKAFYSCMFLERVVLPRSLRKIGPYSFNGCRALKEVVMPEGVREIDKCAFGADSSLMKLQLPDSLQSVDWNIFGGCDYTIVHLSGDLAQRLLAQPGAYIWGGIVAKGFVVDGVACERLSAFKKKRKKSTNTASRKTKAQSDEK